jgi:hypothetical protein
MRRIVENGRHYVIRQGQRIEVVPVELELPTPKQKAQRKAFKPEWVKLPLHWIEVLRQCKSVATVQLAHIILVEAFKRHRGGGEIVLSSITTQMPRNTRRRAAKELVKLGLIKLHQSRDDQAYRVILFTTENKIEE